MRYMDGEIKQLETQLTDTIDFYKSQVKMVQNRKEYLLFLIYQYMKSTGHTKMVTPRGTVYLKTIQKRKWPEDPGVILDWAKKNCPQLIKEKVTEQVMRDELYKYIKATGDAPEGFEEIAEEKAVVTK